MKHRQNLVYLVVLRFLTSLPIDRERSVVFRRKKNLIKSEILAKSSFKVFESAGSVKFAFD